MRFRELTPILALIADTSQHIAHDCPTQQNVTRDIFLKKIKIHATAMLVRKKIAKGTTTPKVLQPNPQQDYTNISTIIIIVTRPKPPEGRQGLAGSWGKDKVRRVNFGVFSTSHFAHLALSSD